MLGQWLSIAESIGKAMCYYILTERCTVITRTIVGKLEEPNSLAMRQEIERFDQAVHGVLQPAEFADFMDPDS